MQNKIVATLRHFAGNEQQLDELRVMQERIAKAQQYQLDSAGPIVYRLALGTANYTKADPKVLTPEVRKGLSESVDYLRSNGVDVDSVNGAGIGEAYFNSVFDYLRERAVYTGARQATALVDGNQFDVSNDKVSKSIQSMAENLWERNWPLGLALRDYVRLADTDDDDEIRRIEELYHLFATPRIIEVHNPHQISKEDIHPAYWKHGDEIPGLWVINLEASDPSFTDVIEIAHRDSNRAKLTGYAADPYASILIRVLSRWYDKGVYSEVVPATGTVRGSRFNRQTIVDKGRELGKTFIGPHYKASVLDPKNEEELLKFFKKENVVNTRQMILEGYGEAPHASV